MRKLVVHKADGCGDEVPSRTIEVVQRIGPWETATFAAKEAKEIADLLADSLPGATFDHLIVELLKIKASHLVVSYASLGGNGQPAS